MVAGVSIRTVYLQSHNGNRPPSAVGAAPGLEQIENITSCVSTPTRGAAKMGRGDNGPYPTMAPLASSSRGWSASLRRRQLERRHLGRRHRGSAYVIACIERERTDLRRSGDGADRVLCESRPVRRIGTGRIRRPAALSQVVRPRRSRMEYPERARREIPHRLGDEAVHGRGNPAAGGARQAPIG